MFHYWELKFLTKNALVMSMFNSNGQKINTVNSMQQPTLLCKTSVRVHYAMFAYAGIISVIF